MFAPRYFPSDYFAPRYFPQAGGSLLYPPRYFVHSYFAGHYFANRYFPGPFPVPVPPVPVPIVIGGGGPPRFPDFAHDVVARFDFDLRAPGLKLRARAVPAEILVLLDLVARLPVGMGLDAASVPADVSAGILITLGAVGITLEGRIRNPARRSNAEDEENELLALYLLSLK
jgi:hypothetical protein